MAINPFEYGRELPPGQLVDRKEELTKITRIIENRGRLFLIGPRRYGKTSLLREIEHRMGATGAVILRYDAEKYETLQLLAQALLTGAMRQLSSNTERARKAIGTFFGRLKPELSYSATDQNFSVSLGVRSQSETSEVPLIVDVLDGINQMAGATTQTVCVVLDEFQHIISEGGGRTAEGQLRSVVQAHHHLSYVFAGSKQRMLIDMVATADRPFWQSGDKMFLGPIPRNEFIPFMEQGFRSGDVPVQDDALVHILDLAEDVPHNVQLLAHACWEFARASRCSLTSALVDTVLERVVLENDPFYTQLWTNLTVVQRKALKAVIQEHGVHLQSQQVSQRYGIPSSTMQKALRILDDRGLTRPEEALGSVRIRLEDPFFATWLRVSQAQS